MTKLLVGGIFLSYWAGILCFIKATGDSPTDYVIAGGALLIQGMIFAAVAVYPKG